MAGQTFTRGAVLRLVAIGLGAQVLMAVPVAAQSLADVARREEARRQGADTGKVYRNGDLRVDAAPSTSTPAPADTAAPVTTEPAAPAAGTPGAGAAAGTTPANGVAAAADPKKDEASWKKRLQDEREAVERAKTFADALQSRINALTGDFARRDDPAQRNVIAADRQKALTELDRVAREIKTRTKAVSDIQEEGRRAGVPAGWLR